MTNDWRKAMEEFSKALQEDPKLMERVKKRAELDDFKEKYNVERASPLKCPACSQWEMSGGSLWGPKRGTTNEFVCRKCKLEFRIECLTTPTPELIIKMRQIQKGS